MVRDFYINGEAMVSVKGSVNSFLSTIQELGLTSDAILISPNYVHKDLTADGFGPFIPNDVRWMLGDVNIRMKLIHFDSPVLDCCLAESTGGNHLIPGFLANPGILSPAGVILGNGCQQFASGNHFISLNIAVADNTLDTPAWHFPSAYLAQPPMAFPLGTEKSIVELNWRAIPYFNSVTLDSTASIQDVGFTPEQLEEIQQKIDDDGEATIYLWMPDGELQSSGAVLWDANLDID